VTEFGLVEGPVQHNQSVMRAVALLRCFVDRADGQTLTELSRRTGINVSTAYRILQTLIAGGLLRREPDSERYVPGIVLLGLAGSAFATAGYGSAVDVLRTLADRTGESASLAVRDGPCAVVLLTAESEQQLRFAHRPGTRIPLHVTAMGHALLAAGAEPLTDAVRELTPLERVTRRTLIEPKRLVNALTAVREHGFAVADEEPWEGVRSVAVSVAGPTGAPAVALGVQGPATRVTPREAEIADALRDVAGLVAALPITRFADELAHRPPSP